MKVTVIYFLIPVIFFGGCAGEGTPAERAKAKSIDKYMPR